ncbi:MAG: hypothetical protein IJ961_04075, partial [Bacteroidales bacterium]|nr:hypothetical protein [Bacteroidales bacterium]
FLMHSIDGGETWSVPQRIVSGVLGNGGGKRGDIAVFSLDNNRRYILREDRTTSYLRQERKTRTFEELTINN